MREVVYHRNAARSMRKIPVDRRSKIKARIEEVAALEDPLEDVNVSQMSGDWMGCFRLRVGKYRAIFHLVKDEVAEILEVLQVGPRGGIY